MNKTLLPSESLLVSQLTRTIIDALPPRWSGRIAGGQTVAASGADLVIDVESPGGQDLRLVVEVKRTLEPRSVQETISQAHSVATALDAVPVVGASYLSPRSQKLLIDDEVGYVDSTGNIRIASDSPGMFILMTGAQRDPWPRESGIQSLRGRASGRALRAIVDFTPPFGIRELAEKTGTSPASLSRVAGLLDREALITRDRRGAISEVDWQGALERWTQDYDQLQSNTPHRFLAPRGLEDLRGRLADSALPVVATGAFGAQQFDPVAPARTAALYVTDPLGVADALDLREIDSGANVILLEPYDPVVFERTLERGGLTIVAASQLAADLLTGPGREPSQGEAILEWMTENEHAWRT